MSRKPRHPIDMRTLRTDADMTQIEVAHGLRVALSTVQYWESGRQPESGILPDIAALFGCSIEHLYGLDAPTTK